MNVITRIIMTDRAGSIAGAAFFTFWIGQRFYYSYRPTALWWLITFQFCLFVIAYLTRHRARERAAGFMETVYPFVCAAMPFALDAYPFKPQGPALAPYPVFIGLMGAGTMVIIAGVAVLRRSFSIMTEVRSPVYGGIYRITRHPMYLGSMISSLGILVWNFSALNLGIFCLFCIMQVVRGRREERKIASHFTAYGDYAARVGWLWRFGRRRNMSKLT